MTTTINLRDGLEALVTGVRTYLAAQADTEGTEIVFGYRELAKQQNQGDGGANRIVFLPGDPNGAAGRLALPRDVGRRPIFDPANTDPDAPPVAEIRPLLSWERQLTMYVWAVDRASLRDELAQSVAVTALFEWAIRAIESVEPGGGTANIVWGSLNWNKPLGENRFGAELVVAMTLIHPLFDVPEERAFPGFSLERDDDGLDGDDADENG